MKKICLAMIAAIILQGCGPTASIVSTGITIAQSGSTTRAFAASGSGLFIKEKTGKQPLSMLQIVLLMQNLEIVQFHIQQKLIKFFLQLLMNLTVRRVT